MPLDRFVLGGFPHLVVEGVGFPNIAIGRAIQFVGPLRDMRYSWIDSEIFRTFLLLTHLDEPRALTLAHSVVPLKDVPDGFNV
ncbi:hypothetical protein MAN_03764, partial [Metarhizium hybridum]